MNGKFAKIVKLFALRDFKVISSARMPSWLPVATVDLEVCGQKN